MFDGPGVETRWRDKTAENGLPEISAQLTLQILNQILSSQINQHQHILKYTKQTKH